MSFQMLRLAGRSLLPVVQGGMGVGISAHRLAGAVARGLFFRGACRTPFGHRIRPVRQLIRYLLDGVTPAQVR